jgi:processive 1,2-diacylglycerol beta-glucosyltransferase
MNAKPCILVLSASVGAGHLRAAQAVELALREVVPEATVRNVDVLELTNAPFRQLYGRFYLDLVNKAPHVLGYFYDLMDQPSRSGKNRTDRLRLALEKLNLRKFIQLVKDEPWDLVINTHFLPAEIIASLRRKGELTLPQTTATTDFETHRLWVNQPCDHYFTATPEGARYLQHWGVPAGDITVTGIPIHPVFAKSKDRGDCLARHGLTGDRPIVLQLSGGFGVGPIAKLYRALLDVTRPIELVTIAGRNEEVKKELAAIEVPPRHRAKVLGFTDQIDELMAAADVVVSKPGGLTTSETLARGAVMAIVNPIPGQESRNSDYLLENGAAIKVNNIGTLAYKIDSLLEDPARMAQLKANVACLARPRAAFDVVKRSLQLLSD